MVRISLLRLCKLTTSNVTEPITLHDTVSPRSGTGRGQQRWIDSLRVNVKGGHGGNGHPKYGGVGGKGGDVVFQCSDNTTNVNKRHLQKPKVTELSSLYHLFTKEFDGKSSNQHVKAKPGGDAIRSKLIGHEGQSRILKVSPVV